MNDNEKTSNSTPVNAEAVIDFLDSALQKVSDFSRHMDNQTNILVVLSSGIFILSASNIRTEDGSLLISLLILAIFSLFSAIIALFSVLPPWFMRKKGQEESLLYNKKITEFESPLQYGKELLKVSQDLDTITQQYALELYNLSQYYYRPKRYLFKIARHLLLIGVLVSLITIAVELISGKII